MLWLCSSLRKHAILLGCVADCDVGAIGDWFRCRARRVRDSGSVITRAHAQKQNEAHSKCNLNYKARVTELHTLAKLDAQ